MKKQSGISWKTVGYVVALVVATFLIANYMTKGDIRFSPCDDAQADLDAKNAALAALQDQLASAEQKVADISARITEIGARLGEIETEIRSRVGERPETQELRDWLAALTTERGSLNNELNGPSGGQGLTRDLSIANIDVNGLSNNYIPAAQAAVEAARTALENMDPCVDSDGSESETLSNENE